MVLPTSNVLSLNFIRVALFLEPQGASGSQSVEYTGISQYSAICVPRKVSEPLKPCGWSQTFNVLMELSQVYLP